MGYGKGVYNPISDHRPYTKRKSIFKRCDFFVSYAVLLYGKWLFYQELFSYKYRKEIDQKFTDSVCSCMPDIDHMLYGTGMAATVYCESGTYKRKTAGDDHGEDAVKVLIRRPGHAEQEFAEADLMHGGDAVGKQENADERHGKDGDAGRQQEDDLHGPFPNGVEIVFHSSS